MRLEIRKRAKAKRYFNLFTHDQVEAMTLGDVMV